MIKYFESTVFNTGADAIVNTVNCDGFMGAGLALEFSLRYPNMYSDYEEKCKHKMIKVGSIDTYFEDNILIVNFPTKNSFKFPSRIQWIEAGLKDFVEKYRSLNIQSIAFPKLGCSNGGLEWNDVRVLMEKYLGNIDLTVYICTDNSSEPVGKEREMLDLFNKVNLYEIADIVKLNEKQINILNQNRPYRRFWLISKTKNIGKITYKKLFQYFYSNPGLQQKLF